MYKETSADITAYYACSVFNEDVMKNRLPKEIFKSLQKTRKGLAPLDRGVAEIVATAMKDWAIEKGATHYTHWFQPMTGITAEKHDSFISPTSEGRIIMEFSGKELTQGEPDASSFPSGGLRATFEARGYTAWDATSDAFVKDGSLYIPTAFMSYSGEALDKKTPLLRSAQSLNKQAKRILKMFGKFPSTVISTVGAEQEYFLIDEALFSQRKDLLFSGRTLFGAQPPRGQEMEDHYFGTLKKRVADFMADLDQTLWKLGIAAKTKHNEVAPAQHELACVFDTGNVSNDHNQLIMEVIKKIAKRHGLYCLLHEKPFEGVNGSGKHNNWSIATSDGDNLLDPGDSPGHNARFLVFCVAIIKAVDQYADLLRNAVASAGNDHRLGADEAPPAIISIFLGDELTKVFDSIESNEATVGIEEILLDIGVDTLPNLPQDNTDRNRTSPLAFTGNKFEFRMPGSAASVADSTLVLNMIVSDVLKEFADILEKSNDFDLALKELIRDTYIAHKRVIYNGNNYSDKWINIAHERGLSDYRTTVDVLPTVIKPENIALYERTGVLSKEEVCARYEIRCENYIKTINIEAQTMVHMVKREILPACLEYANDLATGVAMKKDLGVTTVADQELLAEISNLNTSLWQNMKTLENLLSSTPHDNEDPIIPARFFKEEILPAMESTRFDADQLEELVAEDYWPFPVYGDLLYRI